MLYFWPFFFSFLATCFFVPLVRWVAVRLWQWPRRKKDTHLGNIPRWGGAALIIVFWLAVFIDKNLVVDKPLWGVLIASAVILFFGVWDDLKELGAGAQIAVQVAAALMIIGGGVAVDYLRNPFGGIIRLDVWQLSIFNFHFSVFGSIFIVLWIVLIMNVINWLDGLNGLAGGVSLIGFLAIFLLSISPIVNQPPIGILAMILAGALLGFLIFNFPRAKTGSGPVWLSWSRSGVEKGAWRGVIFLGTSGSMFLGFMLGSLSIFSGSKVATAFLVLGVPILDAIWVIWQRFRSKTPIYQGDQRHLHHKLLRLGLSQRQIALLYLLISIVFGVVALITGTGGKLLAFLALCAIMGIIIFSLWVKGDKGNF